MKKLFLAGLISFSIGVGWCSTAHGEEGYLLLGLYEPPMGDRSYWCRDSRMEQIQLANRKEYSEAAKSFYAKHKGEWPEPYLLEPDQAAIVYRFKTVMSGFNCEKESMGVIKGHDVEDARKQLAERVAKHPKTYRSQPEIVLTWKGSDYKTSIKKDYGGLEITYTGHRSGTGTRVTAQGVNNHPDKSAALVFIIDGKESNPMTVPPGGKFNYNMGKTSIDSFRVYIQYRDPRERETGLVDSGKEVIKDMVSTKDGKLKSTGTAIGGRG